MKRTAIAGIVTAGALLLSSWMPTAQADYDFVADFAVVVAQPPSAYGTNVWWTDEDASRWQARWTELGPSCMRVPISHAVLEPENDNADPEVVNWEGFQFETAITRSEFITRTYTHRTFWESLRDQPDLTILIHFSYLAPWLSNNDPHLELAPYPPNDLAEYQEFVQAVVRYLVETVGIAPRRLAIEAVNEPDLGCGVDPVTPCFWQNWTMTDITDVVNATYEAIQDVDSDIALVGLAECCGTSIVRDLLDNHPEGAFLDALSYHYYSPSGYSLGAAISRAAALVPYGRPIYLDEYGSREFRSEDSDGALWHSWALATLWGAGIAPLQYPISEWPLVGEPYNSMGLFEDWRGDWERKPSYWVHANFFRLVSGGEVISHAAPSGVDVLATRLAGVEEAQAVFWAINRGESALADQSFAVLGFPTQEAYLTVYDNLVGPAPVLTTTVSGSPLVFTATIPAQDSRAFVLDTKPTHGWLDRVDLMPSQATCLAGQVVPYTLTAHDASGNDWDVTPDGTFDAAPGAGGSWVGPAYTTEFTGTWAVTGTFDAWTDTAALQVWAPAAFRYLPIVLSEVSDP